MNNILMNTEMTKAILCDRKTQTRRVIKNIRNDNLYEEYIEKFIKTYAKYQIGETIWVREPAKVESYFFRNGELCMSFKYLADRDSTFESSIEIPERFVDFDFDNNEDGDKDMPKPKWITNRQGVPNGCIKEMARIYLKTTDVRVERLQDIRVDDIVKEGYTSYNNWAGFEKQEYEKQAKVWFTKLWNKTAPKGYKWEDNPYVFAYEFEVINKKGEEKL
ncbi:MAG: hypothetical protein L3I99_05495 [Sulfurimonas sp.]|nr:hypothetical protein [Sulfurimonas sp.]